MHFSTNGTNELVLHNMCYVLGTKKSLLYVGQMDMHGYSILFERGSWKAIKGLFMGYGEDGEMGYKIWIPQRKKVICSRDVVFNEARLLQNDCASKDDHKRVRFLHEQPLVRPSYDHLDAPQRTENIDHPVVLEPEDV